MTTFDIMLEAIKSVLLSNGASTGVDWRGLGQFDWDKLYRMADEQHVMAIVGFALKSHPDFEKLGKRFEERLNRAMIRDEAARFETNALNDELEKSHVDFCPLKGIVLKDLYPQPWMRHMNDVDYLVRPEQIDEANAAALRVGYMYKDYYSVHQVFYSPTNMYELEIHERLLSDASDFTALNENIWDRMELCGSRSTSQLREAAIGPPKRQYRLTGEMTIVYHIAHAEKHLTCMGITARTINDLYLIERAYGEHLEKAKAELADMGLIYLYDALHAVAQAWFEGSELTRTGQSFVQSIIGDMDEGSVVQTTYNREHMFWKIRRLKYKKISPLKVLLPPLGALRIKYPILERHPALLPLIWILRIITAVSDVCAHYARMVLLRLGGARAIERQFNAPLVKRSADGLHDDEAAV